MAAGINFEQPTLDWSAPDIFQEFKRFEQHVEFSFLGPLATADMKHRAGWLGMWIGQQGREIYKTFMFEEGEKENPDKILQKLEEKQTCCSL